MSSVGLMNDRKERPAYVRFVRRAIEDRTAPSIGGRYPKRDVDYALVTPPYSKDVFEAVAHEWLAQMAVEVRNNRLPEEWYDKYKQQYEKWKLGEEMPLDGEPIKGWGVISPAQQANLIALNIRTVEDLAGVNDEGVRRIGMGAGELRDKAKAWISQLKDKGPLTQENALLKSENIALKASNEQLLARNKELAERLEILQRGGLERGTHFDRPAEIGLADVLPEQEPQKRPVLHAKKTA
jgi:hypothetical protein